MKRFLLIGALALASCASVPNLQADTAKGIGAAQVAVDAGVRVADNLVLSGSISKSQAQTVQHWADAADQATKDARSAYMLANYSGAASSLSAAQADLAHMAAVHPSIAAAVKGH